MQIGRRRVKTGLNTQWPTDRELLSQLIFAQDFHAATADYGQLFMRRKIAWCWLHGAIQNEMLKMLKNIDVMAI